MHGVLFGYKCFLNIYIYFCVLYILLLLPLSCPYFYPTFIHTVNMGSEHSTLRKAPKFSLSYRTTAFGKFSKAEIVQAQIK